MDVRDLIDACREVAGGDQPTQDVAELAEPSCTSPTSPAARRR